MHVTGNRTELGKQGLQMRVLGDGEMEFVEPMVNTAVAFEGMDGRKAQSQIFCQMSRWL